MLMTCGVYFFFILVRFWHVTTTGLAGFGVWGVGGCSTLGPATCLSLSLSVVTGLDLEGEGGRVA